MKRIVKPLFIILVELLFLWSVLSCIYVSTPWRSNNYINYLPEHPVYPQYDLTTGEVTNSEEVTFWSANDYVPAINMAIENIFDCFANCWIIMVSLLLAFILPVYYFMGQKERKNCWSLLYYQLLLVATISIVCI